MTAKGPENMTEEDCVYAVSIQQPGGYETLRVRSIPHATRGSNCRRQAHTQKQSFFAPTNEATLVTVDIGFCGVNYADVCVRWGLYSSAKKYNGYPITPGFEFSGTVRAVGELVTKFKPGDEVFGVTMFGAYSTRVQVPQVQLFKFIPDGPFSQRDNACWVSTFGTAWYALHQANLPDSGPPCTVLVHSASGGVGSMLVQIAKARGHKVVGVVGRSAKVAYCKSIGADHVIDKSTEPLWDTALRYSAQYREFHGFHAVFDANGVSTLKDSFRHTLPGGKLVVYGFHSMLPKTGGILGLLQWMRLAWCWLRSPTFDPLELVPANKSVIGFNLSYLFDSTELLRTCVAEGERLAATGQLQPPHITEFPLAACGEAHRAIESGQTIGKLVLNTAGSAAAAEATARGPPSQSLTTAVTGRPLFTTIIVAAGVAIAWVCNTRRRG